MGLLTAAFNPRPRASGTTPHALSDFWYTDPTGYVMDAGESGIALGADTILRCGTVLAAVRFRGDSWAMCPPSTFRKTATGRIEEPDHYSQQVLRNPNTWQTGNRWRHLNGVWMATWGNSYNEIVPGPGSFASELRPMHPGFTTIEDQRADGSLTYKYAPPGQQERFLGQESVLHFRDFSTDGMSGLAIYRLIRNVVNIALLAERHMTTFLRKGSRIAGLLVPTLGPLNPLQRDELRDSVNRDWGGSNNTGTFGVMPYGVDMKPVASTNQQSQFYELTEQAVGAILRALGVPGVVVGYMGDKTATYASAEAFFEKGGIKHCVLPIIVNVEAEEEKSLLLRGDGRQIKHNLDVLLRANTKDRFAALFQAAGGPWMTRNEVRRIEDLNEDPDPDMDKVLTPSNMAPELKPGFGGFGQRALPPAPDEDLDDEEPDDEGGGGGDAAAAEDDSDGDAQAAAVLGRARWLADSAAARVVRREVAAITDKAATRVGRDPSAWKEWVAGYYDRHVSHVVQLLGVQEDAARAYCGRQAAALMEGGSAVVSKWEAEVTPRLAVLTLEGR